MLYHAGYRNINGWYRVYFKYFFSLQRISLAYFAPLVAFYDTHRINKLGDAPHSLLRIRELTILLIITLEIIIIISFIKLNKKVLNTRKIG